MGKWEFDAMVMGCEGLATDGQHFRLVTSFGFNYRVDASESPTGCVYLSISSRLCTAYLAPFVCALPHS